MREADAFTKLRALGQAELLNGWEKLDSAQRASFLSQVETLSLELLKKQRDLLSQQASPLKNLQPFESFEHSGNVGDQATGEALIKKGELAVLIIAGGQGTRLRFEGPKGLYPVTPHRQHTLFQLLAEKTLAASRQSGHPLKIAFMTSPLNHEETVSYFEKEQFFGLNPAQVDFFPQSMLPLINREGNLFLDAPGHIAFGPDGNGSSLFGLWQSGIGPRWKEAGVSAVNVVLIDNPLADPFDRELIGFHKRMRDEITLKCTLKENSEEAVGVLVKTQEGIRVVEYSELPKDERQATLPNGSLKHSCANLSLFCFGLSFIERIASNHFSMPLHPALKAANVLENDGTTRLSTFPNVWKFETFIFDLLCFSHQISALTYLRKECFSPLKNLTGTHSLAEVQMALSQRERHLLSSITMTSCPEEVVEIDPAFYYPNEETLKKWRGRPIPKVPYIEA